MRSARHGAAGPSGGEQVYAPWRQDPRPAGGLLQGVYAHLGIVRFWHAQRQAETDPDDILRAQVQFARWRSAIDQAIETLLRTGCLTRLACGSSGCCGPRGSTWPRAGSRRGRPDRQGSRPGPPADLADTASGDRSGGGGEPGGRLPPRSPVPDEDRPEAWIQEDVRKVDSSVRSRLLNLRYLEPARYRELCAAGRSRSARPDRLLLERDARLRCRPTAT